MSEPQKVVVPDIGDYAGVPVISVLVKPGATVAEGDPLIELESDKATLEVPAPAGGVVSEILVKVGDKLSRGDAILTMNGGANAPPHAAATPAVSAAIDEMPSAPPQHSSPPAAPEPSRASTRSDDKSSGVYAGPGVRKFARELGVALDVVKPSGPEGRTLRGDVLAHVRSVVAAPGATAPTGRPLPLASSDELPWPEPDYAKFGPVEPIEQSRIQKLSAANLARNWRTIPHVTNFDKADVTDTEAFRKGINARQGEQGVKVTMLALMIKAAASALKTYPRFNVSFSRGQLIQKHYYNIGFAADTPGGLVVAVIEGCDRKGLLEIATDAARLAAKARQGTLSPKEMTGGCFTISSLGGIGGTGFTPIINAPEVAILGAGKAEIQPVWNGAAFEPRLIQPLSLSWDHRAVDGAAAARFLGHIASCLADIRKASL
jgi:pyruvate dehydrogenase E2 component (dihydrolipoamide acetyltransferase)